MKQQTIPAITDRMGRHWEQPAVEEITIDETHALMSTKTFKKLAEYSCSQPTGVYDGKMWKRHDGAFDSIFLNAGGKPRWLLMWFGPSESKDHCSVNSREIIIVD